MTKRKIVTSICFAAALISTQGQTFETDATDSGVNLINWNDDAAMWDNPFGSAAANAPGSGQTSGLATDNVIFGNQLPAASQHNYRVQNRDVGTIDNLTIGSPNSTFANTVQLQVRGNNGHLRIEGLTTLGAIVGGTHQAGQIQLNQNNATALLNIRGDITAGSTNSASRLILNATPSTMNIGGDILLGSVKGVDLQLVRGNLVLDTTGDGATDTGAQTLNVDFFDVGVTGLDLNDANYTVGVGKTVNISDDLRVGQNSSNLARSNTGTFNIHGSTFNVTDDVRIGQTTQNDLVGTKNVGTLNVGDIANPGNGGTLIIADALNLGIQDDAGTGAALVGDAKGFLNIYDGATVNTRQVNLGLNSGGQGTVNIVNGRLTSSTRVFAGGDGVSGADDQASGTIHVGAQGLLEVSIGASNQQNIDVGRDGAGTLTVDGGTVNLGSGNLVLGQSAAAGLANNSRGTVILENGATVNVGDTHFGAMTNADGFASSLAINKGGADVVQRGVGTTVRIENNLLMQDAVTTLGEESTNPNSSYTVEGGLLDVTGDFNARVNAAGNNTFAVVGDAATISIGRDFSGAQPSMIVSFDFQNGTTITEIDVGRNANVNGATLALLNTAGLNAAGDILLFDVGNNRNGTFAGLAEGALVAGGTHTITYNFAGTVGSNSIALLAVVPEPSTLALLGLAGAALMAFRRRVYRIR